MARIIAVANVKGGVGKTTTSLNLAAALVERTCRVLVVDLDPQASLTISLGLVPEALTHTIRDSLADNAASLYPALVATPEKFDLVPSSHALLATERKLDREHNSLFSLRQALDAVSTRYDFILLDCPANAGVLTGLALTAAHEVIVPVTTDYLSLQAFGWLWNIVREMQRYVNPRLVISGILLNMYDPRTRNAREMTASIREQYGTEVPVFPIAVHNSVRLKEAPLSHQSILKYAPKSNAAEAFRSLAMHVEQGFEETAENGLYHALTRARQALDMQDTRSAYESFRRATEINPAAAKAWLGRAETADEWDERIRCLDQALRLESSNGSLRAQLERELDLRAMSGEAADALRVLALGYYLEANGEQRYAEQMMRRAHNLMPGNREAVLGLARTTSNSREGIDLVRSFLQNNPGDLEALRALPQAETRLKLDALSIVNEAISHAHGGDRARAARLFEQATELDPMNDRAWVGRAQTSADWQTAFQFVERALEVNPENQEARRLYHLLWTPKDDKRKRPIVQGLLIVASLFIVIIVLMITIRLLVPA